MIFTYNNRSVLKEITLINLTFLFFILRGSIPFFKYPFILLYLCLLFFSIVRHSGQYISALKIFFKDYFLVLFLTLIIVISFFISNKLYLNVFKDTLNTLIIISIFFLMSFFIKTKEDINYALNNLTGLIILFAILISAKGFYNLFHLPSVSGQTYVNGIPQSIGTVAFEVDNNFDILPVLLGFIGLLFFSVKSGFKLNSVILNFLFLLFTFSVLMSSSRRGLIVLFLILFFLLLVQILNFICRNEIIKTIASKTFLILPVLILLVFASFFLTRYSSYAFKNKALEMMGSENIFETKAKITSIIFRYTNIFNKEITFHDLYTSIWTPVFNSSDPESSWGTRNHKNIFPLTGANVEIVPRDARGYMLDNTCIASYGKNYSDAYSLLTKLDAKKGDRYLANVFCYASEDFDGDLIRLTVGTDCINKNMVTGKPVAYYDLKLKGVWKKLEIDFRCTSSDTIPLYISFLKNGVNDFSKLKGYVIFAYPNFEKISSSYGSIINGHYRQFHGYGNAENMKFINVGFKKNNLGNSFLNLNDISYEPIRTIRLHNIKNWCNFSEMLPEVRSFLFDTIQKTQNQDPIREFAAKFISEDTIYYGYKKELFVDEVFNKYGDERIGRWIFAIQIFSREYLWKQKIFGGGFNFTNWYGSYFLKDKSKSDYPHNPLLSVLLYSGIFGLLLYLFFLYKIFNYYYKYRKIYPLLLIFFIITFFFAFFSGGSPFDPPILGYFVILPFFIHSVHKKKIQN